MEKQSRSALRNKKRKKIRKKRIRLFTIFLLMIMLVISCLLVFKDENISIKSLFEYETKMVQTNYKITLVREEKNTFKELSNGDFYHITNDKITLYNSTLTKKWENIHDYVDIQCQLDNDKLVLYEEDSTKVVSVYSSSGLLYQINPVGNVKSAKVNKNGYAIILLTSDGVYVTSVYDNTGTEILTRRDEDENVVLLDYDISNDNKYLVFSYLDLTSMGLKSDIVFQYLNEIDTITNNTADGTFSWLTKNDTIVGNIEFIGNGLYIVTDKEIEKYDIEKNTVSLDMTIPFNNIINDIVFIGEKHIAIYVGKADMNAVGFLENSVVVYDTNGKIVSNTQFNKQNIFIKSGINSYIINMDNVIYNYSIKGEENWNFENGMNYSNFLLLGSNNKMLAIDNTSAVVIERQKIKVETIDNNAEIINDELQE